MSRKTPAALWTLPFSAVTAASKMCWSGVEATLSLGARGADSLGKALDRARRGGERMSREARLRSRSTGGDPSRTTDDRISEVLARLRIPTRREVDELTRRIEELAERIAETVEAAAVDDARRVVHVTPHESGWKVAVEGAAGAVSVHSVKAEAVQAARDLAHANEPCQVVIHRQDGTIQAHHAYGDAAR